jgi:hypothetical protein
VQPPQPAPDDHLLNGDQADEEHGEAATHRGQHGDRHQVVGGAGSRPTHHVPPDRIALARLCILHTGSNSLETMALYIGLEGVDFEVLDPPELVDYVRALGTRLTRAARRSR